MKFIIILICVIIITKIDKKTNFIYGIFKYIKNLFNTSSNRITKIKSKNQNIDLIKLSDTRYPNYISEILSNKTRMDELVEESYYTEFDFIDFKKIHLESFENNPENLIEVHNIKNKEIPSVDFQEINKPNFWIIEYKKLLFIFNGEKMFPIECIINNVNYGWTFKILFVPNDSKIKSNGFFVDNYFIQTNVVNKISDINILRKLLLNFDYLYSITNDNKQFNVNYFIVKSKLEFSNKLILLFERDELPFLISVFLIHENRISYDLEKLIYSLFNCEEKRFLNYLKLSDTSQKILTEQELLDIIKDTVINKETFLKTFQIELILKFLNRYNPKNIKSKINILDINFMSEKSYNIKSMEIESELIKFKKTYYQEIKKVIRQIENQIRVKKGYNLVGTFTQETILFEKLKTYFNSYKVISQGSPKWLKLQRIDIYFPELNIGVEYHGEQHFVPVDYFGGEDGLRKNIERDERKVKLCLENDCKLYIVDKNYNFENLCREIENEIKNRTS